MPRKNYSRQKRQARKTWAHKQRRRTYHAPKIRSVRRSKDGIEIGMLGPVEVIEMVPTVRMTKSDGTLLKRPVRELVERKVTKSGAHFVVVKRRKSARRLGVAI